MGYSPRPKGVSNMKRSLALCSFLALGSLNAATGKPAAAPALPPDVTKTINMLNGKWTLETTMTPPDGKPLKFPETIDCHKGAGGRSAVCVDRSSPPGQGPTEYDYLIGFDTDTKIAHLFAVGSPGEVHDHRCRWSGDKVLDCEPLEATLDGQPIKETFSLTFDGNKIKLKGTTVTKDGPINFEATGTRSAK